MDSQPDRDDRKESKNSQLQEKKYEWHNFPIPAADRQTDRKKKDDC